MTAIPLQISAPTPNTAFSGAPTVSFAGTAAIPPELNGVPLFYRWYSSLFPAVENRYSINAAALSSPAASFPLGMGSQSISLAVSDQTGEDQNAQNAAQHGGVTGGKQNLVVHVFKANIFSPADGALVSRTGLKLTAEAPLKWYSRLENSDPFTPDADYHQTNRLRYRWVFTPEGAPVGRPTLELIPTLAEITYDNPPPASPRLNYSPALPAAVDGKYELTLFVEDSDTTQNIGSHSMLIHITMTA
jgi:hypothetical protein